jgi:hypothetical protein
MTGLGSAGMTQNFADAGGGNSAAEYGDRGRVAGQVVLALDEDSGFTIGSFIRALFEQVPAAIMREQVADILRAHKNAYERPDIGTLRMAPASLPSRATRRRIDSLGSKP